MADGQRTYSYVCVQCRSVHVETVKRGRRKKYCDLCQPKRSDQWGSRWQINVCLACGVEFEGRAARKYCSKSCAGRARGKPKVLAGRCGYCAEPIVARQTYCSPKCHGLAKRQWPTNTCEQCGSTFSRKPRGRGVDSVRFCSRDCAFANLTQTAAERRPPPYSAVWFHGCRQCGQTYAARRRVAACCSDDCRKEQERLRYYKHYRTRQRPRHCRECAAFFTPIKGNSEFCSQPCRKRHLGRIGKGRRRALLKEVTLESVNPYAVFERDGWKCRSCGVRTPRTKRGTTAPNAPELDHIVPISKGGEHSYLNTQCLCRRCNIDKGDGPGGQMRLFAGVPNNGGGVLKIGDTLRF